MNQIEEKENIVRNINFLLNVKFMKQKDLAAHLHVETHTVNQWLKKRGVPPEYLIKVADFFEIPVDFLRSNSDEIEYNFYSLIANEKLKESQLETYFPYVNSDESMKNQYFKEAFEIHSKISKYKIKAEKELVDKCYGLYGRAYINGVDDALVNMLSIKSIYNYTIKIVDLNTEIKTPDEFEKKINDLIVTANLDKVKEVKNYISNSTDESMYLLFKMKTYPKFKELLDYYIAILFNWNLVDISYNESDNALFGQMFMKILCYLENEYAINYFKYLEEMEKTLKKS